MNRSLRTTACFCAILAAAALGLCGRVRPAAAQTMGPVEVANAFADAVNNHSEARLRQLLRPGFQDLEDPGWPDANVVSLDGFIQDVISQGIHVTYTKLQQTDAQTIVVDDVLVFSAPDAPHLPHPFTETSTLTVVDGQITLLSENLSAQTRQELAALAPPTGAPGMPSTGTSASTPGPALFALGLLALLAGWRLRRIGWLAS